MSDGWQKVPNALSEVQQFHWKVALVACVGACRDGPTRLFMSCSLSELHWCLQLMDDLEKKAASNAVPRQSWSYEEEGSTFKVHQVELAVPAPVSGLAGGGAWPAKFTL